MIGLPVASLHTLNLLKAEADIVEVIISAVHLPLKQLNNIIKITIPLVTKRLSRLCEKEIC